MEHCEQEPGHCSGRGAVIAGQRAVQRIYLSGDAADRQYLADLGALADWRALGLLFLLYALRQLDGSRPASGHRPGGDRSIGLRSPVVCHEYGFDVAAGAVVEHRILFSGAVLSDGMAQAVAFFVATAAMAGVFVMAIGAVYAGRGEQEAGYTDFVVRWGAGWAFWGTGLQILAGLWLLFSQPAKVFAAFWGGPYTWLVATVFCLALGFMFWLQRLRTRGAGIVWQRRELLRGLIVFVTVILLLMATTRHLVREIHLEGYTRSQDRNIAVLICGDPDKEAV